MVRGDRTRGKYSREQLLESLGEFDREEAAALEEVQPGRLIDMGREAAQEYDYERARFLYKVAVLNSHGGAEALCALATFLVDEYAIFDEAITILESPSCQVNDESLRLLARAHFMLGNAREALEVYQEINREGGDALSWKREGMLLAQFNRHAEAIEAFSRTLGMTPSDSEASGLSKASQAALKASLEPLLEKARQAFTEGHLEEADEALKTVAQASWLPPAYFRLRHALDKKLVETRLMELLDAGSAAEAAADPRTALALFQQALDVDEGCELALEKVAELAHRLEGDAAQGWLEKGNAHFEQGDRESAIRDYFMAATRSADIADISGGSGRLLEIVKDYCRQGGRMPGEAQLRALDSLYLAWLRLEAADLGEARLLAGRAGAFVEQLEAGREFTRRLEQSRAEEGLRRAAAWMEEAMRKEADGEPDAAASLFDRAAAVKDFGQGEEAARRARHIREGSRKQREVATLLRRVEKQVAGESYFPALAEIRKNQHLAAELPELNELADAARRGVAAKFPLEFEMVAPREMADVRQYASGMEGVQDLDAELTRLARPVPDGDELFLVSGRKLLLLDASGMRAKMVATLPPQADLTEKKGFVVADLAPGDTNALVVVNFDDDLLLYFQHRRSQLELLNVMPLERLLQQSRQQVSRWFVLNGPEEQLVVCQSAPGKSNESRLYSLSLHSGRLMHDDQFGYALSNLRRVPAGEGRYVIHRHPDPMQMRRTGYFSFALADARLRIVSRHHIPPDELDNTFIESTRWLRVGPASGRLFYLFRYFDALTGQLVGRPLAFAACEKDGTLLYAAPDSSTLVRNQGDLNPMAEVVEIDGAEHLAVHGRKDSSSFLFVVELDKFRLVSTKELPPDRKVLSVVRGSRPGQVVVVSLDESGGEVRMSTVDLND